MSGSKNEFEQQIARIRARGLRVRRIVDALAVSDTGAREFVDSIVCAIRGPDQEEIGRLKLAYGIAAHALELAEELSRIGIANADPAFVRLVDEARKAALHWGKEP
ncbi:hypothetical protein [Komagataeibacter sp. FNDCF1]|uniref:hypothetical protein n=1 Tax=Komagataeibacter sp. FNDCF1 TaxID=2878681 RepID=UPI001E61A56B|nr:hypothetical protein [Komagataeibacter sp. FNDCF1]MCE2563747.1 hypothetical protein [Komagataeibacter sp. FNDCF1]